jgi:signal transduction histidine kinase
MRRFPVLRASALRIKDLWSSLSLKHQFLLVGAPLGIFSLCLLGAWIPQKIEEGVEAHSAARTALYMEKLIAPHLQQLANRRSLSEDSIQALDGVLAGDARRIGVLAVRVWTRDGIVAYARSRTDIGKKEEVTLPMTRAWAGYLEAELVERPLPTQGDEANSAAHEPMLEIYVPIRHEKTYDVVAIARFAEVATELKGNQESARIEGIVVGAAAGIVIFVGLFVIVAKGNRTIEVQGAFLADRVAELSKLLRETEQLRLHVQTASRRAAEGAELQLRRLGSDLHDGPAQLLALALLKLDTPGAGGVVGSTVVDSVRDVLNDALSEIRNISAGLALPEIAGLSLSQALIIIATEHERRTSTRVACEVPGKAIEVPQIIKLCLCRVVQEALSNAFRHADGLGQKITANWTDDTVVVEISDSGPGMVASPRHGKRAALGLVGLRSRLESLGGKLTIESEIGVGTRLKACLPVDAQGEAA